MSTALKACRTMVLTSTVLEQLERREGRLAIRLYRYLLAGRFREKRKTG